MYFMENKLKKIDINSADIILTPMFEDSVKNIYKFNCVNNELPYVQILECHIIDNESNTEQIVQFSFKLTYFNDKKVKEISKLIIPYFYSEEIINFFFKENTQVDISSHILTEKEAPLNDYDNLIIKLTGTLKFNIRDEFNLLALCNFDKKLTALKNKKTEQYLITNLNKIKKNINFEQNNHRVLNELTSTFSINSEDFLNALKLQYNG